ncbi:hypothetical protein HanIR_Chr17g0888191 [Helianthus annuus]|nr:hypothetical protein HanIR_Chr17g0888191 [Helianthus annuus]
MVSSKSSSRISISYPNMVPLLDLVCLNLVLMFHCHVILFVWHLHLLVKLKMIQVYGMLY